MLLLCASAAAFAQAPAIQTQPAITEATCTFHELLSNARILMSYTGDEEKSGTEVFPASEQIFVMVRVTLAGDGVQAAKDSLVLQVEDRIYKPRANVDTAPFGYAPPTYDSAADATSGYLLYEVPASEQEVEFGDWSLVLVEPFSLENAFDIPVPHVETTSADQWQRELAILQEYSAGAYLPYNPLVIQNPYGTAPLTALALFHTAEPSIVTVTVQGKDEMSTLTYALEECQRHHEVPIIGLYGGTLNTVTLTLTTEDGQTTKSTLSIRTDPLPDAVTNASDGRDRFELVTYHKGAVAKGLYFLMDNHRTLVDLNGDIRWYTSLEAGSDGVDEILPNGHFFGIAQHNRQPPHPHDAV